MLMIEEQEHVIDQLVEIVQEESVDGVLIAGDVFDRPVPSREALETCERLFSRLCACEIPVFVIPGNHDSPQQLSFCSRLLESAGLQIAKAYDGAIDVFEVSNGSDSASIHLLPFVRPTDVRMAYPDEADSIATHHDAVALAVAHDEIHEGTVNILVAHQFVTGKSARPQTCDSEILSVGGADNVDVGVFDAYDYVALGHLHGPQHVGREHVRYSGSPLKYSFSEVKHHKSVTILTIEGKSITLSTRSLVPLREMREITASFEELLAGSDTQSKFDYMRVILTDRSLPDAMAKLRSLYPNILRLDWQSNVTFDNHHVDTPQPADKMSPLELFAQYYELQTGETLSAEELEYVSSYMECEAGQK